MPFLGSSSSGTDVRTRLHKSHRAVIHFRSFTDGRIDFGALFVGFERVGEPI